MIALNTSALNSGEPLQISCTAVQSDSIASFVYQILVGGKRVANDTKSFVHTIQSVKSTDAGNYTCQVSLEAAPDIVRISEGKDISGRSTALIINLSFLPNMHFFAFPLSSFYMWKQ